MAGQFESILDNLQGKLGKKTIKRASDVARPKPKVEVQQIKIFNEFNQRNPRTKFVQGGTVTFDKNAKLLKQGKDRGKYTIRVHKVGGAQGERVTFVGNKTEVKNFIKSHNKKVIDLATERASKLPFSKYKLDNLKKDLKAGKTLLEIATEIYQGDKEYYDKQPKQFYKTGNKKGVQISPVTIIVGS